MSPTKDARSFAAQWARFEEALRDAAKVVLFDNPRVTSPLARLEGFRQVTRSFTTGTLAMLEANDPAYPQLSRIYSPFQQFGLPSPDCDYLYAAVDGRFRYRLWGERGTTRMVDVQVYQGDHAHLAEYKMGPNGHYAVPADSVEVDIRLSRESQPGTWVGLPDGPGFLIVRQYFYDWESEQGATLFLEREGADYPPPPPTAQELSDRIDLFIAFLADSPARMTELGLSYFDAEPDVISFPRLIVEGNDDQVGYEGMQYGRGHYECELDQAVILEAEPPDCPYWNVQLSNQFWEAMDWWIRLKSINGHQAVLAPDGRFRAVIAHHDPGVPNWLDAGGETSGSISARYYRAPPSPRPTLQVVPFDKVREALPADTPHVTPEQRAAAIRRRMISVRRRMY